MTRDILPVEATNGRNVLWQIRQTFECLFIYIYTYYYRLVKIPIVTT